MPKHSKNRFKSGRRRASQQERRELAVSAQRYVGPIIGSPFNDANHTTTLLLIYQTSLASTVGGVVADVFGNNPSSASNWGDSNAVWGEYRVLAFRLEFYPVNRYSKTTTVTFPVLVDVDRRNSTALTSFSVAAARETCKMRSLEDPWHEEIRMTGSEESQFIAVSAPTALSWFKLYSTGLSVSTTYGLILVKYLVQFRNVE